jgi:type VI secretion system protein ImpA
MPVVDFAALGAPLSEAEPCGPDLDLAGDADYLNFMANAEGLLPESYFAFDPTTIDFPAQFESIGKLLGRTRDVRLLTTLVKFLALDRNLADLVACVETTASLLHDRWEAMNPRPEGGDVGARTAALQSLDDLPTVVLPLQHMPLSQTQRQGAVSYRSYMIATGEVKARQGEQAFDLSGIERALSESDLDALLQTRGSLAALRSGLRRIRDVSVAQGGFDQAPSLEKLPPLVDKMLAFLDATITRRDPNAIPREDAPEAVEGEVPADGAAPAAASPVARGRIASVAQAGEALAAVAAYFSANEPSSPALLLVCQAQQLIGKSFVEVMRILVPARVPQAKVLIGKEPAFSLQLEGLSALAPNGAAAAASGGAAATESGAEGGAAEARTRQDAIALLEEVGGYYRAMEPSSPIPLLTDRARGLVERDFLYLLKDLLPEPEPAPAKK